MILTLRENHQVDQAEARTIHFFRWKNLFLWYFSDSVQTSTGLAFIENIITTESRVWPFARQIKLITVKCPAGVKWTAVGNCIKRPNLFIFNQNLQFRSLLMPTDDFDRELQAALDASAAEAGAGATLLIGSQRSVSRKCMAQREDKHAFIKPTDGTIYQIGTLNQFHVELQRITRENKGPAAICGYIVCAYARLLEQFLSKIDGDLLPENVQGICDILTDMNKVEPELRRVFTEIQDARLALSMSASESEYGQTETLSKWVANYEIGDFLSLHSRSDRTHFIRLNQWPAHDSASWDVRQRLAEEERFGGSLLGDDRIVYGREDSVFFIQTFCPDPTLQSPEEWLLSGAAIRRGARPRILILDLNGHFAVAVACHLRAGDEAGEPSLLLFNTTATNYLDSAPVAWAFDTVFPAV